MNTNRGRGTWIAASIFCCALLLISRAAGAATATWTNGAGNNAWETPGNWDINQVPNSSAFDVRISTAAPCNLSSQFQIGALTLSASTASLNLVPGSALGIAGPAGLNNNGLILVNTTGGNAITSLHLDTSCAITGNGNIQLNGVGPNATLSADGVSVAHGTGHTIRGRGDIFMAANNAVFINNGLINSDLGSGDVIRVFLSDAAGNQNNGTMEATDGATLHIDQGFLDQSGGGSILAVPASFSQNSSVTVVSFGSLSSGHSPTISGGTINALPRPHGSLGTGSIQANRVALNGCTMLGAISSPIGGLVVVLEKGLTNNGQISTAGNIRFDATAVIAGTGNIRLGTTGFPLNQVGPGSISASGVTVTNAAGHTIRGYGNGFVATNNAVLVNNGSFVGDDTGTFPEPLTFFLSNSVANQNNGSISGRITFEGGRLDQSGGGSLATGSGSLAGSRLILGPTQTFTVIGGTVSGFEALSAILGGSNITTSGTSKVAGNGFAGVTAATLTNEGTLTLEANTSLLRFEMNNTAIGGAGAIVLTNGGKLEISAGQSVTNGANHSLKGTGMIQINPGATLTNQGIIGPGASGGILRYSGNLQLTSSSNLSIEVGGTVQGTDYDLLEKTDAGALTLNGTLTVRLISGFVPLSTDTFTITTTQTTLAGAFTNVPSGTRLATADGSGSFLVTYNGNNVVLSDFAAAPASPTPTPTATPTPTPTPAQLLNISSRMRVQTGEDVLIGGIILKGAGTKRLIVRGLGPSLTSFGVADPLLDPILELRDNGGALLAFNDDWKDTQQTEIEQTGLAPTHNFESAIVGELLAENSQYTAVLRGQNKTTGVGLVEFYDLDTSTDSELANISTRGFVGTGENVLIGGIIVGPGNMPSTKLVLRAIGPSLSSFGVSNPLQDPTLEMHDGNGNTIAFNDNWKDSQETEISALGLAPTDNRESAIVRTVAPGNYTAIVRGAGNTVGVGLVEFYNIR